MAKTINIPLDGRSTGRKANPEYDRLSKELLSLSEGKAKSLPVPEGMTLNSFRATIHRVMRDRGLKVRMSKLSDKELAVWVHKQVRQTEARV